MITIANLTGQQIRNRLDQDHWSAKLLSEIVCSVYWGGRPGVDLREMGKLDQDNWTLAKAIMEYRRQPDWDDEAFYKLAVWCKIRHKLDHWAGPGTVLQVYQAPSGQWEGRILRDGVEVSGIGGASSPEDVQDAAYEQNVDPDTVEIAE